MKAYGFVAVLRHFRALADAAMCRLRSGYLAAFIAVVALTPASAQSGERDLLNRKPPPTSASAILYEEDPARPTGQQSVGSVAWCIERLEAPNGAAANLGVRGEVMIPDLKMRVTLRLQRRKDETGPGASFAEITYSLPSDFAGGQVERLPGFLFKPHNNTRGKPILASASRTGENAFHLELSKVESERQHNMRLFALDWLDIAMIYATGRRAILATEKGSAGDRVFKSVFMAWAADTESVVVADFCSVPEI